MWDEEVRTEHKIKHTEGEKIVILRNLFFSQLVWNIQKRSFETH